MNSRWKNKKGFLPHRVADRSDHHFDHRGHRDSKFDEVKNSGERSCRCRDAQDPGHQHDHVLDDLWGVPAQYLRFGDRREEAQLLTSGPSADLIDLGFGNGSQERL